MHGDIKFPCLVFLWGEIMVVFKRQTADPTCDYSIACGSVALAGGAATIDTGLVSIVSFKLDSNTTNRAYATASGGTLSAVGTGTDLVYWIAVGNGYK